MAKNRGLPGNKMNRRKTMPSDVVLHTMEQHNIPMTRENYLEIAYFGNPPEVLDAEDEMNLPEQFQVEPPENFD